MPFSLLLDYNSMIEIDGKTALIQNLSDINRASHNTANAQGKILWGKAPYCNVHGLSRRDLLDPIFGTSILLLALSLISVDKNARLSPSGLPTFSAARIASATVTQQNRPKTGSAMSNRLTE